MIEGKKLLIFDLGGVLIDLHIDRSFAALVELGIPPSILTERNCLINSYMMAIKNSMYWAKMNGVLEGLNPYQAYINQDLNLINRILIQKQILER